MIGFIQQTNHKHTGTEYWLNTPLTQKRVVNSKMSQKS